jgi:hypothetical protein
MTKKRSQWDLVFIRSFNAMVIRIQSNAGWSFMVDNFRGATASADPSTGWPQLVIGDPGDPAAAKIFWGTRELAKAHGLKVTTRSTGPFGGPGAYKKLARRNPAVKKKTTPWRSVVKQLSHASNTALLRASLSPVWDKVSRGTAKSFFSYGVKKGDVPAWYTFPADVGQALIKIRGKSFQIHTREKTSRRGLMTIYYILRTR